MIGRKSGSAVASLMEVTGWQAHSVWSALSGLCEGRLAVERRKDRKGETVYAAGAGNERDRSGGDAAQALCPDGVGKLECLSRD